ncbi:MAG: hypothetical protein EOO61_19450, partial [Hymenobacter sp.]
MAVKIQEIVAEFGKVYRDQGQGIKDLKTLLLLENETDALFTYFPTTDTKLYRAGAGITRVLQGFQKGFTPISDVSFTLDSIELDRIKIDVAEYPDDVLPSWAGFLAGLGDVQRKNWPFVKWWLETLVIPKFKEDLELECFTAVKAPIVAGVASSVNTSLNGIRKKIRDGNTLGKTGIITLGTPPTDPVQFVEYIEEMIGSIDDKIVKTLDSLNMNETFRKRFRSGMRTKYNVNYAQTDNLTTVIDTNLQLKSVTSMAGSPMIWATVKGNAVRPVKWGNNQGVFDVQGFERLVKALSDLWTAYDFWYKP